jgi:hypothetical protein
MIGAIGQSQTQSYREKYLEQIKTKNEKQSADNVTYIRALGEKYLEVNSQMRQVGVVRAQESIADSKRFMQRQGIGFHIDMAW